MKFHHAAIIVILVSMILLSLTIYIQDVGDKHSGTVDLKGLDSMEGFITNESTRANNTFKEIQELVLETEDASVIEVPYIMIKVGWKTVKLMFKSWIVMTDMTRDLINAIGIPLPPWVVGAVISLILVVIVAIILYAFFKWKMSD